MVIAAIMAVSGMFGFWLGKQRDMQKTGSLSEQVKTLQAEKEEFQTTVGELMAEAQTANMRLSQFKEEYKEAIPDGPMQRLVGLVRQQLGEGMDPQRLELAIRAARSPRNCTAPETRRFVISTPAYTGPESKISLAEGAIVIRGSGASARNAKGDPEAWYDPSKKVELEITINYGTKEKKAGVMPLYYSAVVGLREYRFTIEEGARSFAKVTYDSCDYP